MIMARRQPERLKLPKKGENFIVQDNVVCSVPAGTRCLYVSSYDDGTAQAGAAKCRGVYGWVPKSVTFHLVLWDDRPVWVCSEDAVLKDVTDGDDGRPPE
jgi:hypothetical protein